jgi:arabinogalactan oligomer / maltooligosaccharide transport system substrate-binding protein
VYRQLSVVAALGLLVPTLTACAAGPQAYIANATEASQQNGDSCPRPLVVWPTISPEEEAYVVELGQQFQQETGTAVQLLRLPFDDLLRKYVTAVPSGKGPDILWGPSDWTGLLGDGGYAIDLTDRYDTSLYLPNTIEAATYQDRIWGVPKSFEVVAQFYNTELTPEPAQSFDDLKALSGNLEGDNYALGFDITNMYFAAPFLFATGGEIFDDEGNFVLTEEAATAWLTEMKRLQDEANLPREVTSESAQALFKGGNSATFFSGPWEVSGLAGGDVPFKVANLPAVNGEPATPFLGTKLLWVSSTSPCQGAALQFIEFLNRPEHDVGWVRDINSAFLPAAQAAYEDPVLADNENIQAFLQQAETSAPFPNAPGVAQIWTPGLDALTAVINQGADPAAAAKTMVETIRSNLEVRD